MAFKLGDVIIDRLQFGYGANKKTGNPLYALTQLNETTINLTSDSTDIKNKDGSIVLWNDDGDCYISSQRSKCSECFYQLSGY